MVMKSDNRSFKTKLLIGWIVVLTALTTVSIRSAYLIIYDYRYNNKATDVHVKPLQNAFPFLKSISIYYKIYDEAVFPETWAMNETELDRLLPSRPENRSKPVDGWPAVKRLATRTDERAFYRNSAILPAGDDQMNGQFPLGMSNVSADHLPLESLIDVAAITDIVYQMDVKFFICGDGLNENETSFTQGAKQKNDSTTCGGYNGLLIPSQYPFDVHDSILPKITSVVDAFLGNGYGERFTDQAVSRIVNSSYWTEDEEGNTRIADVPINIAIDSLGPHSLQLSIPMEFVANMTPSDPGPFFGVLPLGRNASLFPQLDQMTLWLGDLSLRWAQDSHHLVVYWDRTLLESLPDEPVLYTLVLANFGVFNGTDVRSAQSCSVCGNLLTAHDCVFKCKIDLVIEACRCVPFTYRRLYPDGDVSGSNGKPGSSGSGRNDKPYCTSKHYEQCYRSGKYKPSTCGGPLYVPCVMAENLFEVEGDPVQRYTEHKLNFRVFWHKSAYVVFQEKWKDSWTQMLGQLGGYLGLFLAFSLLSVWKLIVFLIFYFRKRTAKRSLLDAVTDNGPTFLPFWLQFVKMNAETTTTKHLVRKDALRKLDALRVRFEEINGKYEELKNENEERAQRACTPKSARQRKGVKDVT